MSEKVVTEFELNISQFEAQLSKATQSMEGFDKSTDAATASTEQLESELGSAATKLKEVATVTKAVEQSLGTGLSTKAKEASTLFGKLREATGGTIPALKALGKEIADVGAAKFPRLASALGTVQAGLGKVGGAIKEAGKGFLDYGKNVAGNIPIIGGFLTALGPVGLAVSAVAGGIFKLFTNLDAGATAFDGFKRAGGIAFDQVTGAASRLFNAFTDGTTVVGKVFQAIGDGLKFVLQPLGFVADGFKALFGEALAAGQEIANLYDALDEAQTNNIVKNAKAEQQISKLAIQLKDRTKSDEERLKIADEITRIETDRAAEEQKLLKQATDAVRREAQEQLKAKGEVDDSLRKRLAEAEAAEIRAATASTQITERAELRRNAILEQAAAERAAIAAKEEAERKKQEEAAAAARAKRIEEAKKLEADRASAARQAANLEAELAQRRELEGLEGVDRRVREVEIGYEKERAAAQRLFDELAALYPKDAEKRAEVAQQAATAIAAITQSEIAATTALREEAKAEEEAQSQEALEGVRQLITARDVLEREAINKRFDEARTAAEQNIADAQELADTLVAIERARVVAVSQVRSEEEQALIDQQVQRINLLASTADQINGIVQGVADGNIKTAEDAGKAILRIALDIAEKQALIALGVTKVLSLSQPDSIATFGAAGVVRAVIIGALIKGAFALLKSQLAGSFYDGGIVGRDGGTKFSAGRDGYLVRAHQGEYIMPTQKTNQYMPYLEMMRDGTFDRWVSTIAGSNASTTATPVPSFNDRGIVGALGGVGSLSEQRKQTELLAMVARGLSRGQNKRYRA